MTITIDLTPYEVETKDGKLTIPNIWGMEGIETLKRRNTDPVGEFDNRFVVEVEEETVTINPFGCELEEAVRAINDYYPSVGWEFLGKLS